MKCLFPADTKMQGTQFPVGVTQGLRAMIT
ncbi:hypothetical protein EMIT0215P_110159 [Pseudomonas serboccidentalis]